MFDRLKLVVLAVECLCYVALPWWFLFFFFFPFMLGFGFFNVDLVESGWSFCWLWDEPRENEKSVCWIRMIWCLKLKFAFNHYAILMFLSAGENCQLVLFITAVWLKSWKWTFMLIYLILALLLVYVWLNLLVWLLLLLEEKRIRTISSSYPRDLIYSLFSCRKTLLSFSLYIQILNKHTEKCVIVVENVNVIWKMAVKIWHDLKSRIALFSNSYHIFFQIMFAFSTIICILVQKE